MKYEMFIHIGYPKTGTTFLQQFVFPFVDNLNFIPSDRIRHILDRILYQDNIYFDPDKTRRDILEHVRPGKNMISYESLVGWNFRKGLNSGLVAERIHRLFPDAKIIITLRNQYDFLESIYKQYIQEGGSFSFRRFLGFRKASFSDSDNIWDSSYIDIRSLNYFTIIHYYAELFSRSNILLYLYEQLHDDMNGFIQIMLSGIGVQNKSIFSNQIINSGYGKIQIMIARTVNRLFQSNFSEVGIIPEVKLLKKNSLNLALIRRILQSRISFRLFGHRSITDKAVKRKIREEYLESNRQLDETFHLSIKEKYSEFYL